MLRLFIVLVCLCASGARAQEFSGLAHLDAENSFIRDSGRGLTVELHLTQAVPYRVFTLDSPPRLVVDFREVNWGDFAADADGIDAVNAVRFGLFRPGWSRMVVDMALPLSVGSAEMVTDPEAGDAVVILRLKHVSEVDFAAHAGAPESALWDIEPPQDVAMQTQRQTGDRPLRVVLDPGHGGIDPGAQQLGYSEAKLMLQFARELKDTLTRAGGYEVVLTRTEDVFVPLETRVSIARTARADVFLSLHADALAQGRAAGATVYTLSKTASDEASAKLAAWHARSDLLAGVDLTKQDDVIALVLMDLARIETAPRSEKLADQLVIGLQGTIGKMHKRPRQRASFSVLKAPDIPSVLIELGFLSDQLDLSNLASPDWRGRAAQGILNALQDWAVTDAAEARLLRQ